MSQLPCPQCEEPAAFSKKRGCYYCAECELAFEGASVPGDAAAAPAAKPVRPLKLFLSYGRDGYTAEVRALRDALRARGHEVWFDEEQLATGLDWELRIERGLAWCDRVVLTMTPHSVRRPDGYCLNEIAKAMERQKLIIPLLLVEVPDGAPTSICRIQYLDWRDAVPVAEKAERFTQRMARLLEAIEEDKLDFEGGQQRLLRHLQPLNYDGDILHHVARFQGRTRLFERIGQWLADPQGAQRLWLTGAPGLGKSAIAATLAHRWGETGAMHFCVAGHQDKADPARAVLSIAYQLSQRLDLYRQRLGHLELEREVAKDPRTLFDTLLVGPLARNFPAPDKPCLVVIDALDEATQPDGGNPLAELVATQWGRLPPWLRLLVTSRPDVEVQTWLHGLQTLALSGGDPEQLADLQAHLEHQLQVILEPRRKAVRAEAVQRVLDRSEGAFHYVTLLLEDVREGRCDPDDPVDLPAGMNGFYRQSFARRFQDVSAYRAAYLPLLELLLAAPEPVPLSLLAAATQRLALQVRQQLAGLGSLVAIERAESGWSEEWDTARLAHASLRRWLAGVDPATRMPSAGHYAAQPAVKPLAAQVLAQWDDAGSRTGASNPAGAARAGLHGFVGRTVWALLKAAGDRGAMDRVAIDVSKHWSTRKLERALEPAEHAANAAQAALAATSSQPEPDLAAHQRASTTLRNLGDLRLACGQSSAALQAYRQAQPLAEVLAAQGPSQEEGLSELAAVCNRTGDVLQAQGQLTAALSAYRQALSLAEELAVRRPTDAGVQRTLSVGYIRTGDVLQAQGDRVGALELYRAAWVIRARLASQDPADTARQRDLLVCHNRMGVMLEAQGRLDEALVDFRQDLAIATRLAAKEPDNPVWQRSLSVSHICVAGVMQAQGHLDQAVQVFGQALAIRERLARLDPMNAGAQYDLSEAHNRVAEALDAQGMADAALGHYRHALVLCERLAAHDPAHAGWQQDLAAVHHAIGGILISRGDLTGAEASFGRFVAMVRQALLATPQAVHLRHQLAIGQASLAHVQRAQGRLEDAWASLAPAREVFESLYDARDPGSVLDLASVTALGAGLSRALAQATGARGPWEAAEQVLASLPITGAGLPAPVLARRFRQAFLPLVRQALERALDGADASVRECVSTRLLALGGSPGAPTLR